LSRRWRATWISIFCYVSEGGTAKARVAYQEFLALWKDADPENPVLQQAKAEYAKLLNVAVTAPS
jgi:hypothetical protein